MSIFRCCQQSPQRTSPQARTALPRPAERALESVAVLDVSAAGTINFATARAKALLAKYFPTEAGDRLPEAILFWLRNQGGSPALHPLRWTVSQGETQLVVRHVDASGGCAQLLLDEAAAAGGCPDRLRELGMTRREGEVLFWIARGKTSSEIATILACKTSTVNKHTERIFAKLGVETRTAAAVIAMEFLS